MKKYGILANPAGHSLSPAMHNAAFKRFHMQAEYDVFEIPENELAKFMKSVRNQSIEGLSVSLPYKEKVMQYLDKVDKDAQKIGAVNTIINKEGFLYGFNTDYVAANKALFLDQKVIDIEKKSLAVVIGGGGAARAVCYGLLKLGMNVVVANRTREKADAIAIDFAEMFHESEIHSSSLYKIGTGDILINTTSIWTKDPSSIDGQRVPDFCRPEYVKEFHLIMDICYKPLETPLIKAAKRMNKAFITGDRMLLYQAIDQFELWTGKKAPVEVMKEALETELKKN